MVALALLTGALFVTRRDHPHVPLCSRPRQADGIDVSAFQGTIDWTQVAKTCVGFAYVRLATGTTLDPTYATNVSHARAAGLHVGAYLYLHPDEDALAQAQLFIAQAGYRSGDLAPVLDIETTAGLPRATLVENVRTWLTTVEAELGVRPMIYTNASFWDSQVRAASLTRYPLWIANYTKAARPSVPQDDWSGAGWTVWQYSSHGRIAGIDHLVDLDRAAD